MLLLVCPVHVVDQILLSAMLILCCFLLCMLIDCSQYCQFLMQSPLSGHMQFFLLVYQDNLGLTLVYSLYLLVVGLLSSIVV